jgi:hypothetical protein
MKNVVFVSGVVSPKIRSNPLIYFWCVGVSPLSHRGWQ